LKSLVILLTYASERNSRGTFCDRLLRQCRDYLLPVLGASPDDAGVADLLLLPAFEASADIAEEPETFALSVVVFFLLLFLLLLVFLAAGFLSLLASALAAGAGAAAGAGVAAGAVFCAAAVSDTANAPATSALNNLLIVRPQFG
jgi:hypothetical protein